MSLTLPPLSLYVHIPWCIRKCPYCDFNSHEKKADMPEADYVDAVIQDLKTDAQLAQGRKLTSIFFGGGTPSLFSPTSIEQIISAAEKSIGFELDIEITLEANPGTFEQEKFRGFRASGVNRLSIGIQSFNDVQLKALGRVHDQSQALNAVSMARNAGFTNINLDLMHGLPEQSVADACADLQQAIDLAPEHISWYQLTIEQNTQFYSAPPLLPLEDILADIQDAGQALLASAGYAQYEVSAYAQANRKAAHNINYWQYGDYLGIGAGAHAKISFLSNHANHEKKQQQEIIRFWKKRAPQHYLGATQKISMLKQESDDKNLDLIQLNPFLGGSEILNRKNLPLDFLMNGLRLNGGVDQRIFFERTGLNLQDLEPAWSQLSKQSLVTSENGKFSATPLGYRFLNRVLEAFSAQS